MQRDIRETALYQESESLHRRVRCVGSGLISDAAEVSVNGTRAAFAGTIVDVLNGAPPTRICVTELGTGDTRVVTFGPNIDRSPKFSPDGSLVAFLSDRHKSGDFQLYLLDIATGAVRAAPRTHGWVEYLHWSPDGKRILLGVAGFGADISGGQGGFTTEQAEAVPPWVPKVEAGDEDQHWRRIWVYELATARVAPACDLGSNVWEAVWCGSQAVAAVASPGPKEGLWYSARLHIVEIASGEMREIYTPRDQLGWPSASPSGQRLAVVEAICSDRWLVAGDLQLIDVTSGRVERLDTQEIDVTYTEWRSDRLLLVAGHRGFETAVGVYDAESLLFKIVWSGRDITTAGRYVTVAGFAEAGDCVLVGENFRRAPELAVIRSGHYKCVRSFDVGYSVEATAIDSVETVVWQGRDGLEIQGWLLLPKGEKPHPLVLDIHGGPVWHWRQRWLGRTNVHFIMLLKRGYAIFLPNPRGSAGRGQEFARRVVGDMGGADTGDYLSGLDYLIEQQIADPRRLGVTGASYGGFMTAWLVTQDSRFAAAVAVAPIGNQVTEHLISNIPHFVALFLGDSYKNPAGKYFQRSPIMHAHEVKTPTLNVCGGLDRCTPPEEAVQFHNALLENGVDSVLVMYPEEGHGIRNWPSIIDYAARVVGWFEEHMGHGLVARPG